MARQGKRDLSKERFWRRMVGLWRRCRPVTVRDFCAEHGLSEPSFYSWRRTLAQRDGKIPATPRQLGERSEHATQRKDRPQDEQPAFVPLTVLPSPSDLPAAPLELVLPSGHILRLPPGFDAATLSRLLVVLQEKPSC
jgi:transposase-like protein